MFQEATFADLRNFSTFSLACLFYFTFGLKVRTSVNGKTIKQASEKVEKFRRSVNVA